MSATLAIDEEVSEEEPVDESSAEFINDLVTKLLLFVEEFTNVRFFPYQSPIAYSLIESIILGDGEEKTMCCTRQSGKALALDTPIPTPTGWAVFGDLAPGDLVYGPTGRPVRVLARTPVWQERPCYRVSFNDGTSIVADENHEWLMSNGSVLTTRDLVARATERRGHGIDLPLPIGGSSSALPVDPYVFGAWLGDGGSRDGRFTSADPEIVDRIREHYKVEARPSYGPYGHYIYGLSTALISLGVMDSHGSAQNQRKHIPLQYLRASYTDRVALLQGLMDTDGYISTDGRCEFCVTRRELADGVLELLRSLGIKARIIVSDAVLNGVTIGDRYRIHFSAFLSGPIPFYLPRKRSRLLASSSGIARSQRHFVTSVEPVESVPVRCIQVEGGLFVAGEGWVVTHNSEIVANVIAGLMVILPRLARVYPDLLGKFDEGFWVGVFAPTEDQADTIFGRVVSKLTSDHATTFLLDPDISDKASAGGTRGKGKLLTLKKSGSSCRMQTCNPKAKIESKTYHFIVIDEAQEADETTVTKSIKPMLAWHRGSIVLCGTAQSYKSYFYTAIQRNKRRDINGRSRKKHHHEYDWKVAGRYNKNYLAFIKDEKERIGEDSVEFRLSYNNEWMLDKGMFISPDRLASLYDKSMPLVHEWWQTPIVVGIDVARSNDSTVITPVWVDWDHPDPFGFFEHRILNWHEINNVDWESQYFEIIDFLRSYNVMRIGVDSQGVGGPVAERLQILLPKIEVISVGSDVKSQNDRWNHLTQLVQRQQLFVPGQAKAIRTKRWQKFNQQMGDLERVNRGPYMLASAPEERNAYDDYPDSAAIACYMSIQDMMPTITETSSPFFR